MNQEAAAAKHGRVGSGSQAPAPAGKPLTVEAPPVWSGALGAAREAFRELRIRAGRQASPAMMEADREASCGPKGRHRELVGPGEEEHAEPDGLGERRIESPRLRVRRPEGEAALAISRWASGADAPDAHTMQAAAEGSTRSPSQDPGPDARGDARAGGAAKPGIASARRVVAPADAGIPPGAAPATSSAGAAGTGQGGLESNPRETAASRSDGERDIPFSSFVSTGMPFASGVGPRKDSLPATPPESYSFEESICVRRGEWRVIDARSPGLLGSGPGIRAEGGRRRRPALRMMEASRTSFPTESRRASAVGRIAVGTEFALPRKTSHFEAGPRPAPLHVLAPSLRHGPPAAPCP